MLGQFADFDLACNRAIELMKHEHETLFVKVITYGRLQTKEYHICRKEDFAGCNPKASPALVFTAKYKPYKKKNGQNPDHKA